jgi:hypothetical protein
MKNAEWKAGAPGLAVSSARKCTGALATHRGVIQRTGWVRVFPSGGASGGYVVFMLGIT